MVTAAGTKHDLPGCSTCFTYTDFFFFFNSSQQPQEICPIIISYISDEEIEVQRDQVL